jgi:hypothetical protein
MSTENQNNQNSDPVKINITSDPSDSSILASATLKIGDVKYVVEAGEQILVKNGEYSRSKLEIKDYKIFAEKDGKRSAILNGSKNEGFQEGEVIEFLTSKIATIESLKGASVYIDGSRSNLIELYEKFGKFSNEATKRTSQVEAIYDGTKRLAGFDFNIDDKIYGFSVESKSLKKGNYYLFEKNGKPENWVGVEGVNSPQEAMSKIAEILFKDAENNGFVGFDINAKYYDGSELNVPPNSFGLVARQVETALRLQENNRGSLQELKFNPDFQGILESMGEGYVGDPTDPANLEGQGQDNNSNLPTKPKGGKIEIS